MKKFAYALIATMTALLGFGSVASAYPPDYPPTSTPITVPDTDLPVTGSGGVSSLVLVAVILLTVGVGLFVTAQVRRRSEVGA